MDFLKISFDESEGRIIMESGRVPEGLDPLKSGENSIVIETIDSNNVVRSQSYNFLILKPSGIVVTE